MKRHWSFIVCNTRILFPIALLFTLVGLLLAFYFKDPTIFSRSGNFIIAIGVWMSMRYVFREGLNRNKNALDSKPTLPNRQLNPTYFNNITFSIGDAKLSIKGFILVVIGSTISSFGDLLIKFFFRVLK